MSKLKNRFLLEADNFSKFTGEITGKIIKGILPILYPYTNSPLCEADKCFDHIPIYYQDGVMYIDTKTGQIFNYATHISCDNNPEKVKALDLDTDKN